MTCLCANTPSQSPSTRPFTIPSSLARALALSTALPHAGDWLNRVPICCSGSPSSQPGEFRCCLRYSLGVPLHCTSYTSALNVTAQQTGCGGNGDRIARHNAIRDVLYTLLPWHHLRRYPTSSPVPSPDRLTSTSPTWSRGCPAALHLPSPSSSRPWVRLPSHLATHALLCRSVSSANQHHISLGASLQGWSSSLSWPRRWEVWRWTPSTSSGSLGRPFPPCCYCPVYSSAKCSTFL